MSTKPVDNTIIIERKLDDLWALVISPEWFAQIFEGVTLMPIKERPSEKIDIRQQIGGRWIESSVIRVHLNDEKKELGYKIGSSYLEIFLEAANSATELSVNVHLSPTPSPRVLQAYTNSLKQRLKQLAEA